MVNLDSIMHYITVDPLGVKIFWSIMVVIVMTILSKLLKNILYRQVKDNKRYYSAKQKINYGTGIIIIVFFLFIWLDSVDNLTTYIGLLSAGIAIALKEIFTNMAGWLFIEIRKPFEVGHRVMIGNQKGDVIDTRLFQFSLMEVSDYEQGEQSTGRIIDVPNGFVFLYPTVNYTKGFEYIWNEVKVLITFESNWEKAKELLVTIGNKDTDITTEKVSKQIKNASRKYMIHYNKLTPIVYTDVRESGVLLTLRYLCEPKNRRSTTNMIWEDVLKMVAENEDIDLAYPTRRVISSVD